MNSPHPWSTSNLGGKWEENFGKIRRRRHHGSQEEREISGGKTVSCLLLLRDKRKIESVRWV